MMPGDFGGLLAGLLGERLHLVGDDREPVAGALGPCRFDGGV